MFPETVVLGRFAVWLIRGPSGGRSRDRDGEDEIRDGALSTPQILLVFILAFVACVFVHWCQPARNQHLQENQLP